jgi:hypothetical protein
LTGDHYLIVPPTGLLEVIHADQPLDIIATLVERGDLGEFVRLSHGQVTACWMSSDQGWMNPRAREVFADLTKVHLVFTGNVIFTGMEEKVLGEVVGRLSLRDTAGGGTP